MHPTRLPLTRRGSAHSTLARVSVYVCEGRCDERSARIERRVDRHEQDRSLAARQHVAARPAPASSTPPTARPDTRGQASRRSARLTAKASLPFDSCGADATVSVAVGAVVGIEQSGSSSGDSVVIRAAERQSACCWSAGMWPSQ